MRKAIMLSTPLFIAGVFCGVECYSQVPQSVVLDISVKYFECIDPTREPPCVCTSEEEKSDSCPGCLAWAERHFSSQKLVALDPGDYRRSGGSLPANYFVNEVAGDVYGITITQGGPPPTTSKLYADPSRYGWLELDEDADKTGSIALWPGGAGLVVGAQEGDLTVLYPSYALNGALHTEDLGSLAGGRDVKYLIPEEFVTVVSEQLDQEKPPVR